MITAAETYLLTYSAHFLLTVLLTINGLNLYPHTIPLMYDENINFYTILPVDSPQIAHIEANPNVTLSLVYDPEKNPVVVSCTAWISNNQTELDALSPEQLKKLGYSGNINSKAKFIRFAVHSLTHDGKTLEGLPYSGPSPASTNSNIPLSSNTPKCNTKEVLSIIRETITANRVGHLFSTNNTTVHARLMQTLWHDKLGMYHITYAGTRKLSDYAVNPHCALLFSDAVHQRQLAVEATATMHTDTALKTLAWAPHLAEFGFEGPESDGWVLVTYAPTRIFVREMIDGKEEGRKEEKEICCNPNEIQAVLSQNEEL